jgi:Ca2+-binding RTX toxin-like protein
VRYDDANYGNLLVSLIDPARNTGAAAGDRYAGIEGLMLGAGNDYGWGNDGDNYIYGLGGNDMLFGGRGADYLDGGSGFDYVRYDDANYGNLLVSLIDPARNTGAAAGDRYAGIEGLMLGAGNDYGWGNDGSNYIYGLDGDDMLYGLSSNDHLFGGNGDDVLDGGEGNDFLYGGMGEDMFVFRQELGHDKVLDFDGGYGIIDTVDFSGVFGTFKDLLSASSQVGQDVVITLSEHSSVTLSNFYLGNLNVDDFIV